MSAARSTAAARSGPATSARRVVDLLIGAIASILRSTLARYRRRQTERELSALSDWQLKDIGVHRSHIWHLAYGGPASSTRSGHAED